MKFRSFMLSAVCLTGLLANTGCKDAPGKPGPEPEVGSPEELVNFPQLYRQNCAGCHGSEGKSGAAISLANPVYLQIAGVANIERVTGEGVAGTMMPGFSKKAGGMLTDQQVRVIAQGMVAAWGNPDVLAGAAQPAYQGGAPGDQVQGQKSFAAFCARCHGADGSGLSSDKTMPTGSLVDPAYLALVSDQSLRSTIIAGQPERGMPDWRSGLTGASARSMTDEEITNTVAWLASHRVAMPGQPYQTSQH
jgi:mono/diheme cytochrome c family protein